jgi:hypothetical protein
MNFLSLVLILVLCSGCAILDNLDGAMTLKGLSQEKDAQHAYVQGHDAQFGRLVKQLETTDGLKRYQRKANLEKEFGAPILCQQDGGSERCLWRRIVEPAKSPKVYIYFDAQGSLVRWEKL